MATNRPDCQQQRTFLMRMYFGADDERGGFTRRAYLDLSRTLHGLANVPSKEDMKDRATAALRSAMQGLTAKKIPTSPETLRSEFDQWHGCTCDRIMKQFEKFHLAYGQAQKWLNMTIKYRWFFSERDPLGRWFGAAHIPVDDLVLRAARAHNIVPTTTAAWSRWEAQPYKAFQESVREHADKCGVTPLEIEHRWWMDQSEP